MMRGGRRNVRTLIQYLIHFAPQKTNALICTRGCSTHWAPATLIAFARQDPMSFFASKDPAQRSATRMDRVAKAQKHAIQPHANASLPMPCAAMASAPLMRSTHAQPTASRKGVLI